QSHDKRDGEREGGGPRHEDGLKVEESLHDPSKHDTGHDAEQAAEARQGHRFDQELLADVAPFSAQGTADADLPGALRHGGQHDVHDPDAADQERDAGDRAQDTREQPLRLLGLLDQLQRHDDLVVLARVILLHRQLDDLGGVFHVLHAINYDGELADV